MNRRFRVFALLVGPIGWGMCRGTHRIMRLRMRIIDIQHIRDRMCIRMLHGVCSIIRRTRIYDCDC